MKLFLSLAICLVGCIHSSHAGCKAVYENSPCLSKADSIAKGNSQIFYQGVDGPCFTRSDMNEGKPTCFFEYDGFYNYHNPCICGSDCACPPPAGPPAPATTCQTTGGSACISQDQKNPSKHWLMTGQGSCFLYGGSEYCYTSTDSGSFSNCDCNSHSSCKCGTTVVVTCDKEITSETCSADKTKYCATSYDLVQNGVTYKHTMCDYCGVSSDNCKNLCKRTMSSAQQNEIVDKHNELRSKVARGLETTGTNGAQPKAADMNKLVWDDELAAIAQRFADQCKSGHDKNRKIAAGSVGQNFYASSLDNDDVDGAATAWYSEVKDMDKDWVDNFSDISNADFKKVGHYTQVVWAKTQKVGCGFIVFDNGSRNKYIVCNYYPVGNVGGSKIYTKTTGAAGSGCSALGKTQNTSTGLCE